MSTVAIDALEEYPALPTGSDASFSLRKLGLPAEVEAEYLEALRADIAMAEEVLAFPLAKTGPDGAGRQSKYVPKSDPSNKYNAWAYQCTVPPTSTGDVTATLLQGDAVVLKDNVALAGVPCLVGGGLENPWMPDADAPIVTRILAAGGTITGKATCERFCMTPTSNSACTGIVENPHAWGFCTGGSSSGTAALLVLGEARFGIGGDQGGSIRIPCAHCGLVGLKPTWGLVPYTGIAPGEATVDHTGPMTRTVEDNARLLQAIAGYDGIDERAGPGCPSPANLPDYVAAASPAASLAGMKVGILKESLEAPGLLPDMRDKVRAAALGFAELGATVEEVSVPLQTMGSSFARVITTLGTLNTALGRATGMKELYQPAFAATFAPVTDERARALYATNLRKIVSGSHMIKHQAGVYGKAVEGARQLGVGYDEALKKYDVLILPVMNMPARRHADPKAGPITQEKAFSKAPPTHPLIYPGS